MIGGKRCILMNVRWSWVKEVVEDMSDDKLEKHTRLDIWNQFFVLKGLQLYFGEHVPTASIILLSIIDENPSERDRLGMNFIQSCDEILEPQLASFTKAVQATGKTSCAVEDGHPAHTSGKVILYRLQFGFRKIRWCGNSPDLNPIEGGWYALERRLKS